MYEIVNESNLTIAFDMDTQLSPFGAFGIYIKQGNHCCSAIIDTGDWWGIHRGYNELVDMNQTCKGKASFRHYLSSGGNKLIFTLDFKGSLNINVVICEYNYECKMTIENLDQTYLPVNDTLRMYKNDDIRMYNFDCITDTIVEVITTCNTYTLLTVHLL